MYLIFTCICEAFKSCSLSKNFNVFHNDFFIILLGCVFQPFTFGLVISFSLICAACEIVHPDINVLRTLFGYRNFFKIWRFSKSVTIFTNFFSSCIRVAFLIQQSSNPALFSDIPLQAAKQYRTTNKLKSCELCFSIAIF